MDRPLMPKATAVWLIDNTTLTFAQIADYVGFHELEIAGIADGDVAVGIKGQNPIDRGELTQEEIHRCEQDSKAKLRMKKKSANIPPVKRKGPKYTPLSKRQDRPAAIAWLIRYHPELSDSQIIKLVGTTKTTLASIRDKTHWNTPNIKPTDPVILGFCTQVEINDAINKAAPNREKYIDESEEKLEDIQNTILPTAETVVSDSFLNVEKQENDEADTTPSADSFFDLPSDNDKRD